MNLTEAHRYAMRTFDSHPIDSPEIETIDLQAGNDVIHAGLVELAAPIIGRIRLRLTEAGRKALAETPKGN